MFAMPKRTIAAREKALIFWDVSLSPFANDLPTFRRDFDPGNMPLWFHNPLLNRCSKSSPRRKTLNCCGAAKPISVASSTAAFQDDHAFHRFAWGAGVSFARRHCPIGLFSSKAMERPGERHARALSTAVA